VKILVLRFSSLGDVILTTPLLKTLKQIFPDSQIDYCIKSPYLDILKFNPNLNRIIEVDNVLSFEKLRGLRKALTANTYDLIIDAHNNLRTFYLKIFLRRRSRIVSVKKYSIRKLLLVKLKINLMKNLLPIGKRLTKICGEKSGEAIPEIFTNKQSEETATKILTALKLPSNTVLVCIISSTRHFTKTYPPEYFAELINKFDKNRFFFLLTGKGDDRKNIEIIRENTGPNVYDLCDKLTLLELAEIMKRCKLVIAGDTGPMHIAEALNIPLITIAGSSVKEFGFFPVSGNSRVIENEGLKCRPCTHIGRDKCPLGHFKCMRELKPELIYLMLQHKFLYS